MSIKLPTRILAPAMALLISAPSWACPLCHTSTATEVREGLNVTMRDKSIWMAMLLPFIAIGGVVRVMNGGGKPKEDP